MKKRTAKNGYILIPDGQLYYERYGEGFPVILLHGNGENHCALLSYVRELREENYQIILMDSRGHGRSELNIQALKKTMNSKDMAEDIFQLMKKLRLKKAVLFGFSDGANTALEFAALYPKRAHAVVAVSPNAEPEGLRLPVRLFSKLGYHMDSLICELLSRKGRLEGLLGRYMQQLRFYHRLLLDSPHLSKEKLHKITCPVLMMAGTKDLIKGDHIRWMDRQMKNCHTIWVKGASHLSFYHRISWYLPVIKDFLKENIKENQ